MFIIGPSAELNFGKWISLLPEQGRGKLKSPGR
jgi:hypothetical protein